MLGFRIVGCDRMAGIQGAVTARRYGCSLALWATHCTFVMNA